jgi:hypothetical protein
VKRKIFPALLSRSERRALTRLSTKSRCSESATVRDLIHNAELSELCRSLVRQLVQDRNFRHRAMLLREIRNFNELHGGVPELERLLQEHNQ